MDVRAGVVRVRRPRIEHALGFQKGGRELLREASIGIRGPRSAVLVRQIAGLIARRIVTDGRPGDQAVQGTRLGMIRFGSRVDVFVPRASQVAVRVAVGDRVHAGASVLAEYAA